jgi:hypothetical protein
MFRSQLGFATIVLLLVVVLLIGAAIPAWASGMDAPRAAQAVPAQSAPIEGSIFPALLQVALVVLVTEGIKSLARALGGTNPDGTPTIDLNGKAAALAYIVVGVFVYVVQVFVLPSLPPQIATQLAEFLSALAVIIGGSGLYSMTSALRVRG